MNMFALININEPALYPLIKHKYILIEDDTKEISEFIKNIFITVDNLLGNIGINCLNYHLRGLSFTYSSNLESLANILRVLGFIASENTQLATRFVNENLDKFLVQSKSLGLNFPVISMPTIIRRVDFSL